MNALQEPDLGTPAPQACADGVSPPLTLRIDGIEVVVCLLYTSDAADE